MAVPEGMTECRNCAAFRRMQAPHGSREGQGLCTLKIERDGGSSIDRGKYLLTNAGIPDSYDPYNPWSAQIDNGGCFSGIPFDWTAPRR